MAELIPGIRIAVRAVIIRDAALLVQHKVYEDGGVRYTLPGGAPNLGETLEQGLKRECFEELGVVVEVCELLNVADFHKPRDTDPPTSRQQVELLFRCCVPDDYQARNGHKPDKHQVGSVWLPMDEIAGSPLFPSSFKEILIPGRSEHPVYLGLID